MELDFKWAPRKLVFDQVSYEDKQLLHWRCTNSGNISLFYQAMEAETPEEFMKIIKTLETKCR
jgi:hypothetical protein